MSSNNQGRVSNTILTNRSKYMTVVTDEPYCRRKFQRYGLLIRRPGARDGERIYRGSRPLHQTTLTLERLPASSNYLSTMKDSFSGRPDVPVPEQLPRCPSLHTSQFKVGLDSKRHLATTCNEKFTDYHEHPIVTHEDRTRWKKQMAGNDMMSSTRYHSQIDFDTTYSRTHLRFSSQKPSQLKCQFSGPWESSVYNIINGQPTPVVYNSVSGNRILHNTRKEPLTSVLCS